MSTSTNGQLCYGIGFEEGYQFPWDEDIYEGDIEEWWIYKVLGFKHSFEVFDSRGNYLKGFNSDSPEVERYFKEKRDFKKNHPSLPVELVNYCSLEVPAYILAVPESIKTAHRGYPKEIDINSLSVSDDSIKALLKFCKDHDISVEEKPKWYLSSYWG